MWIYNKKENRVGLYEKLFDRDLPTLQEFLPVSGQPDWKDGQALAAEKDFEIKYTDKNNIRTYVGTGKLHDLDFLVAVPLPVVKQESEKMYSSTEIKNLLHTILNCREEIVHISGFRMSIVEVHNIKICFNEYFDVKEDEPKF